MERRIGLLLIALAGILYIPKPVSAVFIMTIGSWLVAYSTQGIIRYCMVLVAGFFTLGTIWFILGMIF